VTSMGERDRHHEETARNPSAPAGSLNCGGPARADEGADAGSGAGSSPLSINGHRETGSLPHLCPVRRFGPRPRANRTV